MRVLYCFSNRTKTLYIWNKADLVAFSEINKKDFQKRTRVKVLEYT